jgi:hypothetical protein
MAGGTEAVTRAIGLFAEVEVSEKCRAGGGRLAKSPSAMSQLSGALFGLHGHRSGPNIMTPRIIAGRSAVETRERLEGHRKLAMIGYARIICGVVALQP